MKWLIEKTGPNTSQLVITVTPEEQEQLRAYRQRDEQGELKDYEPRFQSDDFLHDLLEEMTTNDEYTWLPEGTTGDITSAPMLGILGDEIEFLKPDIPECSGFFPWSSGSCRPVLERWAFMDYALTSPQGELAE